ncbi:MAG: hypothetical protein N3C12_00110 [Candidatus Binatia bacterium]|nr:hypothetical protein [Candidatus Binatia bacterium]
MKVPEVTDMAAKAATKRVLQKEERNWFAQAASTLRRVRSPEELNNEVAHLWKVLQQRWVRLAREVRREGAQLLLTAEKQVRRELQRVRAQAERLVEPLENNVKGALRRMRKQVTRLEAIARQSGNRLLVQQFEVAPRKDVERLRERVAALEKQLARLAKSKREAQAPPVQATTA